LAVLSGESESVKQLIKGGDRVQVFHQITQRRCIGVPKEAQGVSEAKRPGFLFKRFFEERWERCLHIGGDLFYFF
jgi:hypothetical protein